jgi:hypothetical protein
VNDKPMPSPYDQFDADIKNLIRQGCSISKVSQHLLNQYPPLIAQAAEVLKHIQAVERKLNSHGR